MVAGNLASVVQLAEQSMLNAWTSEQFAAEMDISSGLWLVADNGTICGYLMGSAVAEEAEMLQLGVVGRTSILSSPGDWVGTSCSGIAQSFTTAGSDLFS